MRPHTTVITVESLSARRVAPSRFGIFVEDYNYSSACTLLVPAFSSVAALFVDGFAFAASRAHDV